MKILYVIFSYGGGQGGHFHSLHETARKVSEYETVHVLSIGKVSSPVLSSLGDCYFHAYTRSHYQTIKKLFNIVKNINPDVIHAFDSASYFFARAASILYKIPVVLTKCGGANPVRYFPYANSLILYSSENLTFFKNKYKFNNSKIYFIPNRVSISFQEQDFKRIMKIKEYNSSNCRTIVRVARISDTYKKSILQAINLTLRLVESGHNVKLFIIGVIQDYKIYKELAKYKSERIIILTDDEFTRKASSLISAFDMVIGTGRGFMEAALLGKIMLVPCDNLDIPILATRNNIDEFFSLNFSPRISSKITDEKAFNQISNVIIKQSFREGDLLEFAKLNFSSDDIHYQHIIVYNSCKSEGVKLIDFILHFYTLRNIFK